MFSDEGIFSSRFSDCNHALIVSDKLQGVIRNPFVFYFPKQRGFSGSIQTLPLHSYVTKWTPDVNAYEYWLIFTIPMKKN